LDRLIGCHDDHDGRDLRALRLELFLHPHEVLAGDRFQGIDRPAVALGVGDHQQDFAAETVQLKPVGFQMFEFGGEGVFMSHQSWSNRV
jgi:hypothetical protein